MLPQQILDLPLIYLVGLIGLFIGGLASYFANLLLYSENLIGYPSVSGHCNHKGQILDALPVVSFFLVKDKCKFCQRRVRWQYPLAEILLAISFIALFNHFGFGSYALGMAILVTVLLTICITDFRTKIIPHEITYPAILVGIIFSAIIRADLLGSLAGIGISYILFDFLAFYGLKIYIWFNQPTLAPAKQFISKDVSTFTKLTKRITSVTHFLSKPSRKREPKLYCKGVPIEELEILGGGDAVLSALISAWLGWQKLIFALIMGFIVGTVMGAVYVFIELSKERLLKTAVKPIIYSISILCFLAALMLGMLATSLNVPISQIPYMPVISAALVTGFLLGVIIAGSKISKPFPFGPALAAGAFIAIFREP